MGSGDDDYLAREARARKAIDRQLRAAGWAVQQQNELNLSAAAGVAVREFTLEKPHGRVDYLLFVNGKPIGVIEAKPEGTTLTEVEHQSGKYVSGLPAYMRPVVHPLPFIYESTGTETRFTNGYDPEARSRRVFTFHRPQTLAEWARQIAGDPGAPTFRARLRGMPPLDERGLWGKQGEAIRNLEQSLAADRPRALIQMATGSGKTFTAANQCYRLIRYAGAKRILFLVDRSNLGRQAKLEFDKFTIAETQRKFPAEYNVQHLAANTVDTASRVVISTIQRVFSILRGDQELDPELDERSGYELSGGAPVEVAYNPALPPDAFDEPVEYTAAQLDRAVVAQDQIRTVIQTFSDKLFTELFPGRTTVPKTLIFAKDDSHADDIVQVVREVFGVRDLLGVRPAYRSTVVRPVTCTKCAPGATRAW
jgi:type I restriction enzyme R subunit